MCITNMVSSSVTLCFVPWANAMIEVRVVLKRPLQAGSRTDRRCPVLAEFSYAWLRRLSRLSWRPLPRQCVSIARGERRRRFGMASMRELSALS